MMSAINWESPAWKLLAYAFGYAVILVGGHVVIGRTVWCLWKDAGGERPAHQTRLSSVLGYLERWLYMVALQLQYAQFIALWLGIKTAGTWSSWRDGVKAYEAPGIVRDVSGRQVFNIFLVGSALNIAFAVLGERLIHWLVASPPDWCSASIALLAACLVSSLLVCYVSPDPGKLCAKVRAVLRIKPE